MGCSIDFAVVVKDGKERTVFLEMNDGYALGNYGLYHLSYAKLISARWSQLLGREDVFDLFSLVFAFMGNLQGQISMTQQSKKCKIGCFLARICI